VEDESPKEETVGEIGETHRSSCYRSQSFAEKAAKSGESSVRIPHQHRNRLSIYYSYRVLASVIRN
jgi:hypothetical protein